MLIKYNKNSEILKKAFDIIMKFLGVEDYEEIPIIFKKTEEQMADVQMHICELLNEKHKKEEIKQMLLEKIEKEEDKNIDEEENYSNEEDSIESINNIEELTKKFNRKINQQ